VLAGAFFDLALHTALQSFGRFKQSHKIAKCNWYPESDNGIFNMRNKCVLHAKAST